MINPSKRREADAGHADPLKIEAPGKAQPEYSKTHDPATVTDFPRDRKILRSTAAMRQAELIRLFQGRRALGLRIATHMAVWTLAATLGSASAGPYPIPKRQRCLRWYGLTLESLRIAVDRAALGEFSDDELLTIIRDIERGITAHGPRLIRAEKLGELLQVTAAEREEFSLRTIEACDESRDDRKIRQAGTRKARDVERKRAERGCIPWAVYQAQSLSATKPWETEGVSRRTWERRRQRDANLSTHVLESQGCVDTIATAAVPSTPDGSAGAARQGTADRRVAAGGHSPRGRTMTGTFGQTRSAGAAGGTELPAIGSDPVKRSENLLAVMPLKESPPMPDATALINALSEAEAILKAQQRRLRGKARDVLDEVLRLLPGMVMICEWDRHLPDHVAVCAEGAALQLRRVANDNFAINGIIRRLAA